MRVTGVVMTIGLVAGVAWMGIHGFSLSSAGSRQGTSPVVQGAGAVPGQAAPNFVLATSTGRVIRLSQFRGREPVYLNFWTTWCTYCKHEIPALERMQTQYGHQIAIIGVDLTGEEPSVAKVRQYMTKIGMNYPVLMDTTGQVADSYLVHSIPTSVVINRQGIVQNVFQGEVQPSTMAQVIQAAIAAGHA